MFFSKKEPTFKNIHKNKICEKMKEVDSFESFYKFLYNNASNCFVYIYI